MFVPADQCSNLEQLFKKLQKSRSEFIDPEFSPQADIVISSSWNTSPRAKEWQNLQLLKASDGLDPSSITILPDKITPWAIHRGQLQNSYLISSLRVLAEHSELLRRLFPITKSNNAGIYSVWLNDNGMWRLVVIDDYLPFHNQQLVFARTEDMSLWISLLEKAYAKIHGGYENIEGGFPEESLRDLTGAPCDLLWREQDSDKIWDTITNAIKKCYLLAACTPVSDIADEDIGNGLLASYAYSILGTKEISTTNGTKRLLQIRNPSGESASDGEVSVKSDRGTEDLRKNLGIESDDQGLFWISIENYLESFEATCVLRLNAAFDYYSVNLNHSHDNYTILRMKVTTASEITLSINQKDSRYFQNDQQNYSYSCARILVARAEGERDLSYMTGAHEQERNLQTTANFEPGDYIITLELHWNQAYHKKFNFSVYTEHPVQLEGVENADLLLVQKNILKSIINDHAPHNQQMNDYEKIGVEEATRSVGYIHGLVYYYYENTSTKNTRITETVEVHGKNLHICHPHSNDSKFEIVLHPQSEELVVYKIVASSWSWKSVYNFHVDDQAQQEAPLTSNHADKYIYIDSAVNRYNLQVSTSYNDFIKRNYTIPRESQAPHILSNQHQSGRPDGQPSRADSKAVTSFNSTLKEYVSQQKLFTDADFPPEPQGSLYYSPRRHKAWNEVQYKRLSQLITRSSQALMNGTLHSTQVKQQTSVLEHFSSAIAILAEQPDSIKNLLYTKETNSAGIYGVWICVDGQWQLVTIDDYIPVTGQGRSAFSYSTNNDGWVPLLEKAYAKVYGSYESITNGLPEEVLRDLTGAPFELYYKDSDSERIWQAMLDATSSKFHIAGCTPTDNDDEPSSGHSHLQPGRAYAVLDAREVTSTRGKERIIQLRDSMEELEWEGDWRGDSSLWTSHLQKELNTKRDSKAVFWMTLFEYMQQFEATAVLKYGSNYYYSSVQLTHSTTESDGSSVLRLMIEEPSEVTISIDQRDAKKFAGSQHKSVYDYSCGRILVGKVEKSGLTYVTGAHNQERNINTTTKLEPGTYVVSIDMHWVQDMHREFTVSFYSGSDIHVEKVSKVNPLNIQKSIIKSMILDSPPETQEESDYARAQEPKAKRISGYAHGMLYYYYLNRSTANTKIREAATITGENLRICEPFDDDDRFEVEVLPNDELLVMFKVISAQYQWKTSYTVDAQKVNEYDQVQFQPHAKEYSYEDDPSNCLELEVNTDYNKYIRQSTTEELQRQHNYQNYGKNRTEEEKSQQHARQPHTTNQNKKVDKLPHPSKVKQPREQKRRPKHANQYPAINMKYGQANSMRVKYTNKDNTKKLLKLSCSNPRIVNLKTPLLDVDAHGEAFVRLRFIAPKKPDTYIVTIEITADDDSYPEETLQFRINSTQ